MTAKIIGITLWMLLVMGFWGCSATTANRRVNAEYIGRKGIVQAPWWESGGIDIDWPY